MKKKEVWMAAAALGLFAGGAYAQSSVTLYGVADAGVEFMNHQKPGDNTVVRMQSGNPQDLAGACAAPRILGVACGRSSPWRVDSMSMTGRARRAAGFLAAKRGLA